MPPAPKACQRRLVIPLSRLASAPLSALLLVAACGSPPAANDGAVADDVAPFPLDAYPAKCGVALVDSFETAAGAAAWSAANWADVTLDAAGAPAVLTKGSFGATNGKSALGVPVRFPGAGYHQGYVGRSAQLSLAGCASLAVDVTLPAGAPANLRGALILLLGAASAWNGQVDPVTLTPGATTTVRLPLAGGIEPVPARDLYKLLRGVGFKIDGADVTWSGTLGLDNLRAEGLAPPSADDLNAHSVGTFGGFVRAAGADIPTRNGFLTFSADRTVQGHALLWPKLGPSNGDFVVGAAWFGSLVPSGNGPWLAFHDWSLLEAVQDIPGAGLTSAFASRAFPAVRYTSPASSFEWVSAASGRAPMARLAVVENGALVVHALDTEGQIDLAGMSEPWMLLYAGPASGWPFDAPLLLTFQRRPRSATPDSQGVRFDFASAVGSVNVVPLTGLRRRSTAETSGWDAGLPGDAVVQSRALVSILAAFPDSLSETSAVNEAAGTVTITDTYTHQLIQDEWGTVATPVAPLPPAVYHAGLNGYPVQYPSGTPVQTQIATWFGPFAYQAGTSAKYTLPLAAALTRQPVALRVDNSPASAPVRAELLRVLAQEVPNTPGTYWLGNDQSDADFLCDAWPTLAPTSAEREKARTVGPTLAENTYLSRSVATFVEPVTGQSYLAPTSYPASVEPFDKEWNTGRQLATLARCSEAIDLDVARGLWPKILAMYRYHRIFFDWATGSVLSSTQGYTELADGMHFDWDGMLGAGRLARKLGDEATWRDAAYRTARQQAALYNAWFHALWVQDIDYAVGHISDVKLPRDLVETRGAIDGYVEDFGSSTLEFSSFWQTANYLYFDVPAQLSFYRDYGLETRVRTLEYDLMPALHPSWTDGNAMDPVDQRYYGSNYTSAHLVARALLFHDDPGALFTLWGAAKGTLVASQWYSPYFHGLSGPTLLSIERGKAPLVELPVAAVRLAASSFDAAANKVKLDFQAVKTGVATIRTRTPGGAFKAHAYSLVAGKRYVISFTP